MFCFGGKFEGFEILDVMNCGMEDVCGEDGEEEMRELVVDWVDDGGELVELVEVEEVEEDVSEEESVNLIKSMMEKLVIEFVNVWVYDIEIKGNVKMKDSVIEV